MGLGDETQLKVYFFLWEKGRPGLASSPAARTAGRDGTEGARVVAGLKAGRKICFYVCFSELCDNKETRSPPRRAVKGRARLCGVG